MSVRNGTIQYALCSDSMYWCDITVRTTVGVLSFFGLRPETVVYWYPMSEYVLLSYEYVLTGMT